MLFWVQELLPGSPLDLGTGMPGLAPLARLLPELIRLNEAQAGLGTGAHRLGDLIRTTLAAGGDGYCVHATLERDPRTRDLLALLRNTGDRYGGDIPDHGNYVHYDFNPANLLSDGTAITGVIDLNPPVVNGDRAFDLATLLFYVYDHDVLREGLRARLLELAAPGVSPLATLQRQQGVAEVRDIDELRGRRDDTDDFGPFLDAIRSARHGDQ
jgi:Phosphotransferase enzyme family